MAEQPQAFADARVLFLFPTCVWLHDLKPEHRDQINAQVIPKVEALLEPREETIKGGIWQTHHDLHHLPEFKLLLSAVDTAIQGALDFLQIDHGGFQITGCWANVNPTGSGHRQHTHPNNYLSAVYYARTPDQTDGLLFHDPRQQAHVLAPKVKKLTDYTASDAKLDVMEGRLVIFPSWLEHSVRPTAGQGERVSISCNIMLSSYAEEFGPPRWSRRPSVPG